MAVGNFGLGLGETNVSPDYTVLDSDVLVVGAGGAGCSAAIVASDAGAHVTLLDKGRLGLTGSTFDPFTWGKGITVAARGFNPSDDPEVHYRLAIEAARGLANPVLARIVAYEAPARFRELLDAGFPFRANQLGACFGKGMIGAVINQPDLARAFRREIERRPIRLLEGTMAAGLLGEKGRCTGVVAATRSGEVIAFRAKAVILVTGGASTIFRYNFNAAPLTGDGQIMALEAGATLTNLEFYQAILGTTHPARVFFPQWFLGGVPPMRNAAGRAFLPDYLAPGADPDQLVLDRSFHGPFTSSRPTGRVDIAIYGEILAGRGTAAAGDERRLAGVWCDFAALPEEQRRELDERRGRPALAWLRARRMDLEAGPVPIAPFAHAFNGGIVIDEHGQTAVPGLYACGEVAAGPHGANRVGGHMAAVLLVFGARAGKHAARAAMASPLPALDREGLQKVSAQIEKLRGAAGEARPHAVRRAIQTAMSPVMIGKDAAGLEQALAALKRIREEHLPRVGVQSPYDVGEALGLMNLLETATLVARSALLRKESRGPHYRTDFPAEGGAAFERNLVWRWEEKGYDPSWASQIGPQRAASENAPSAARWH